MGAILLGTKGHKMRRMQQQSLKSAGNQMAWAESSQQQGKKSSIPCQEELDMDFSFCILLLMTSMIRL
jgi:hypothetical protein